MKHEARVFDMQMQMQVFDLDEKKKFHLWWKAAGGVLSGFSLGVRIHSPEPNGRHLLAFDCMNN